MLFSLERLLVLCVMGMWLTLSALRANTAFAQASIPQPNPVPALSTKDRARIAQMVRLREHLSVQANNLLQEALQEHSEEIPQTPGQQGVPQRIEAAVLLAWNLYAKGEVELALNTLEETLALHAYDPLAPFVALQTWPLWQASQHQNRGIEWTEWISANYPQTPYLGALYTWVAKTLLSQQRTTAAQQIIQKALVLQDLHADTSAHLQLLHAIVLAMQGQNGWQALLQGLLAKVPWPEKERALWLVAWQERSRLGHNAMLQALRQRVEQLPTNTTQGSEHRAALSHFIEARFAAWQTPKALQRAILYQQSYAASAAPPHARALSALRQADLLILAKKPKRARQALQAAIQHQPNLHKTPAAVRVQALILATQGQLSEAILLLQGAIVAPSYSRAKGDNSIFWTPQTLGHAALFEQDTLRLRQEMANLLRRQGQCTKALAVLGSQTAKQPALRNHPKAEADVRELAAWNEVLCLSQAKHWQKAAQILTPLIEHSPLGADATYLALNIQWQAGHLKPMQTLLQKLLAQKTLAYNGAVASWQGVIAAQQQRYPQALSHLNHALTHTPKNWGGHAAVQYYIGMMQRELGQVQKAEQHFLVAVEALPLKTSAALPSNTLAPWTPTAEENQHAKQSALKVLIARFLEQNNTPQALALLQRQINRWHGPLQQQLLLHLRQQVYLSMLKVASKQTKPKKTLLRSLRTKAKNDGILSQRMQQLDKALRPLEALILPWSPKTQRAVAEQALQRWQKIQQSQGLTLGKKRGKRKTKWFQTMQTALRTAASTRLGEKLQQIPLESIGEATPALLGLHRQALGYLAIDQQTLRHQLTLRMQQWLRTSPDANQELAQLWHKIQPDAFAPQQAVAIRQHQATAQLQWGKSLAQHAAKKQQLAQKATRKHKKRYQKQAHALALKAAKAYVQGFDSLFLNPENPSKTAHVNPTLFALAQQLGSQLIALPPQQASLMYAARWQETLLRHALPAEQRALKDQLAWVYLTWAKIARMQKQAKPACGRSRYALERVDKTRWEFQLQALAVWQWGIEQRCARPKVTTKSGKKRTSKRAKKIPSPIVAPNVEQENAWQKTHWNALIHGYQNAYNHIPLGLQYTLQRRTAALTVGQLLLQHRQQGKKAQPWLILASAKHSDNIALRSGYLQANWLAKTGQNAKAIATLQAMIARPGAKESIWHLPLQHQLALLYHQQEAWKKALRYYRLVAAKKGKKPYAPFATFIKNAQQQATRIALHLKFGGGKGSPTTK